MSRPRTVHRLCAWLLCIIAVAASACGSTATPAPTATPTGLPPTATAVPATATTLPTPTLSPRATATWPPSPSQTATPTPQPPPSPTSSPVPAATPLPSPTAKHTSAFVERPLAELSPEAAAFLDQREGPRGAAVVVPSRGVVYTYNGDELTPMASVAKVTIMITVMDKAVREKRPLTDWEMQQLRPMITVSDNDSATALWEYIGGGAAVEETLRSMGLTATKPNPMEAWGASRSTPKEVALLLTKLALGEILDEERRRLALELMGNVVPDQTWGVTAGVPTDQPERAAIAIKDGWLPTQGGWWVNSAGLIMPLVDQPAYALAVLTRQQPTMEYGIATIEGVASRIHAALHGRLPPGQ